MYQSSYGSSCNPGISQALITHTLWKARGKEILNFPTTATNSYQLCTVHLHVIITFEENLSYQRYVSSSSVVTINAIQKSMVPVPFFFVSNVSK